MHFAGGMFVAQIASAIAFQADRILISVVWLAGRRRRIRAVRQRCEQTARRRRRDHLFRVSARFSAARQVERAIRLAPCSMRWTALLLWWSCPCFFPRCGSAQPFLKLWLGVYGTPDLALAFQVLLVAFAIPAFAVPVGHVLAASGRSGPAARFSWLTAGVMVGGIITLVPPYGLLGAVVAVLRRNVYLSDF